MYIYLRYYLKHFFICGYGVLVFFLIIKFPGSYTVTLKQAIVVISIATILALATASLHILSVKSVPNARLEEALSTSQARCIEVALETHEAFYESIDYLQTALECTIEADLANGEIKARTGLSWESWGEMIILVLREKGPKLTSIEIKSRPWLGSSSLDSGKNYCNVEEVARYLNRFAPAKPFSYRG